MTLLFGGSSILLRCLLLLLSIAVAILLVAAERPAPPFLLPSQPSVDPAASLQQATIVGQRLHQQAVQTALQNYNTDDVPALPQTNHTCPLLDEYTLQGQHGGVLPDFQHQLPRKVYVTNPPLFSPRECQSVIRMAEQHFCNRTWDTQTSGQYQVAGFYIRQVPAVHQWFVQTVKQRIFPLLCQAFPDFVQNVDDLCVDQSYLFKYNTETGQRTDVHTDSGCLAFTIALNDRDEYTGGGTWFEGLADTEHGVIEMDVGQVTIRPGGLKHCGNAVTSGTRYIIGGFCMHRQKAEVVRQLLAHKQHLEDAIRINPLCDAAYNTLANQYMEQHNYERAREVLEYCLQHVHPTSGEVAFSLASIYTQQGEFQKAKDTYLICLRADPYDVDAMMGVAQASAKLGDTATEREYYHKIIQTPAAKAKVVGSAYCNLGVLHEGEEQELEYYLKSIAVCPESFEPRYSLACALASREMWQQAVDTFREAVPLAKSSEYELKALRALYRAAAMLLRQTSNVPQSKEEMLKQFQSLMGQENYDKLAATA